MSPIAAYLVGTGLSLLVAVAVLQIVRGRLTQVLAELCESEKRAGFWVVMVNLTVCLAATLLAMMAVSPGTRGAASIDPFWGIVTQMKYALGGMIASLVVLSVVIGRSIVRFEERQGAARRREPLLPRAEPRSSPE